MVSSKWWSFRCLKPRTEEQQKWTDVHASAARTDVQPVDSTELGHEPQHCDAAEGRRDLVCLAQGGWCDTIVRHVPFCVCVLDEHGHAMLHTKSIDANGLPYHDCLSQILGCDLMALQECMACVNGGLTWQCHLAGVRSSPDPYPSDMEERQQQEPAPQAPMPMGAQPSPEPSSSGHHGQQLGIPISEQGAAPPPASLSPCQDPSTLSSQCALLNSLSLATATFSDLEAVAALTTTADDQAAAKTLALTSPSDGPALAQGLKAQVQPRLLTSSASAHMMMMVPGAEPFDRGYGRVRGSKSQKEYCMMMARSADCQEVSNSRSAHQAALRKRLHARTKTSSMLQQLLSSSMTSGGSSSPPCTMTHSQPSPSVPAYNTAHSMPAVGAASSNATCPQVGQCSVEGLSDIQEAGVAGYAMHPAAHSSPPGPLAALGPAGQDQGNQQAQQASMGKDRLPAPSAAFASHPSLQLPSMPGFALETAPAALSLEPGQHIHTLECHGARAGGSASASASAAFPTSVDLSSAGSSRQQSTSAWAEASLSFALCTSTDHASAHYLGTLEADSGPASKPATRPRTSCPLPTPPLAMMATGAGSKQAEDLLAAPQPKWPCGSSADGADAAAVGSSAEGRPEAAVPSLRAQAEEQPTAVVPTLPLELTLVRQPGVSSVQVTVKRITNHAGQPGLLVVQQDVSAEARIEGLLADLAESQLNIASNLFPRHIVEYLSTSKNVNVPEQMAQLARRHKDVTLLFMDIVGFTAMSKEVAPEAVMVFLNTLFALFDALCDKHGVMKVETAGDCYIVAGGILDLPGSKGREKQQGAQEAGFTEVLQEHDAADSAARVMAFAKDMMAASQLVRTPHNGQPVVIRIGLHTGNCVSGLIGQKIPKFAVFGDTMNVASRMESTCIPGRIQLSAATASLMPHELLQPTGGIQVKGQGVMETFLYHGFLPLARPTQQMPGLAGPPLPESATPGAGFISQQVQRPSSVVPQAQQTRLSPRNSNGQADKHSGLLLKAQAAVNLSSRRVSLARETPPVCDPGSVMDAAMTEGAVPPPAVTPAAAAAAAATAAAAAAAATVATVATAAAAATAAAEGGSSEAWHSCLVPAVPMAGQLGPAGQQPQRQGRQQQHQQNCLSQQLASPHPTTPQPSSKHHSKVMVLVTGPTATTTLTAGEAAGLPAAASRIKAGDSDSLGKRFAAVVCSQGASHGLVPGEGLKAGDVVGPDNSQAGAITTQPSVPRQQPHGFMPGEGLTLRDAGCGSTEDVLLWTCPVSSEFTAASAAASRNSMQTPAPTSTVLAPGSQAGSACSTPTSCTSGTQPLHPPSGQPLPHVNTSLTRGQRADSQATPSRPTSLSGSRNSLFRSLLFPKPAPGTQAADQPPQPFAFHRFPTHLDTPAAKLTEPPLEPGGLVRHASCDAKPAWSTTVQDAPRSTTLPPSPPPTALRSQSSHNSSNLETLSQSLKLLHLVAVGLAAGPGGVRAGPMAHRRPLTSSRTFMDPSTQTPAAFPAGAPNLRSPLAW